MTNWMVDTMVSMTLLMALVLIIRKPVGHFFGAHIAYLLWALPLARLFMPTLTLKAPAPVEVAEAAAATPLLSDIAITASGKAAAVSTLASIDWVMIALVVWIGGAGMLFISKLAAYFQFREDIVSDGQLVGRHGRIKILETAAVGGPLAFGLFEKYIAVPTNFFRDYAPRERELALEHEIAHHESGDLTANFVGLLVLSLHWFNPVAWYAWIAFRQDQETACDARVLQNGGRDLRAVYGRTIAKSVSGHQLGLASPLNQKNKIKDRLKMLGQTEKTAFRKRMGALMVGVSTVVALPLTATVTYAVEVEAPPHEDAAYQKNDIKIPAKSTSVNASLHSQSKGKLNDEAAVKDMRITDAPVENTNISRVPVPPAAPAAPAALEFTAYDQSSGTINITMLNGEKDWAKVRASGNEHVHKINYNGRTVVLRTNKKLSKDEIRTMVEDAEESRREAQERLRESKIEHQEMRAELAVELANAKREVREAQREAMAAAREAQREAREAQHEAMTAAREAQQEAREAQREGMAAAREAQHQARKAQQQAREARSVAARIWDVSQIAFKPYFRSAVSSSNRSSSSRNASRSDSMSSSNADCGSINTGAMNREIAFAETGAMDGLTWTSVVGCSNADQKAALIVTMKALENKRAKAAACTDKDAGQWETVKAFDRDIKNLRAQLSIT